MSTVVIRTEGLGKRYHRGSLQQSPLLRDHLSRIVKSPLSVFRRPKDEIFWALKDVSLEVREGEILGIIGRNGAGKTSLLKILSRITRPTTGWAEIHGRVGSLLEVGTGFHPELTGRENIFLNGAILGMKKAEIARKFDEIVAFAEVERFIDTPVKHYSSGMYVRLAFAVAAHLEPEILLVDEVLAVGDAQFQKKCLGRMGAVAREGRTILFISHNMGAINRLCGRVVWIDAGTVRTQGRASEVMSDYLVDGVVSAAERSWDDGDAPGSDGVYLRRVSVAQDGIATSTIDITKEFSVELEVHVKADVPELTTSIMVLNSEGQVVLHTADLMSEASRPPYIRVARCSLPAHILNAGSYTLNVASDQPHQKTYFQAESLLKWDVQGLCPKMARYPAAAWHGYIGPGIAQWSSFETSPGQSGSSLGTGAPCKNE
jgi:lipopolysaccharide transport system ATP-binding protein